MIFGNEPEEFLFQLITVTKQRFNDISQSFKKKKKIAVSQAFAQGIFVKSATSNQPNQYVNNSSADAFVNSSSNEISFNFPSGKCRRNKTN